MKNITLTGVLVADQWEADGNIAGLALLADDESKYLISPEDFGDDFKPVLRKKITVKGIVLTESHEKRIRVLNFNYTPVTSRTGWP